MAATYPLSVEVVHPLSSCSCRKASMWDTSQVDMSSFLAAHQSEKTNNLRAFNELFAHINFRKLGLNLFGLLSTDEELDEAASTQALIYPPQRLGIR